MSGVVQITRGADFIADLTFSNANQTPINLTGYTLSVWINWSETNIYCTVNITDAVNGRVQISLDETQTLQLPIKRQCTLTISYRSPSGHTSLDRCFVEAI